jgi:hypothetical protein
MQPRQEASRIITHDELPIVVPALRVHPRKIPNEAAVAVCQLLGYGLDVVIGVQWHLPFFGWSLQIDRTITVHVPIRRGGGHPFQLWVELFQRAQHLVERMIFERQQNDVFNGIVKHAWFI